MANIIPWLRHSKIIYNKDTHCNFFAFPRQVTNHSSEGLARTHVINPLHCLQHADWFSHYWQLPQELVREVEQTMNYIENTDKKLKINVWGDKEIFLFNTFVLSFLMQIYRVADGTSLLFQTKIWVVKGTAFSCCCWWLRLLELPAGRSESICTGWCESVAGVGGDIDFDLFGVFRAWAGREASSG